MREPKALIGTEQLAAALGQSDLRIYDCTTYLEPTPPGSDDPYIAVPGRKTFEEGHVPGADFLDLQGEFSDEATRLRFMMPATGQLEVAFGRHGLGEGARVVLYSIGSMMWATRFWWMLRSLGFDGAAVLDGGFDKWKAEGQPRRADRPGATRRPCSRRGRDRACSSTSARCWAQPGSEHGHRQCARPPVPQGPRAEPVRPAGSRPGQRQCPGGNARRSGAEGFHHAGRRRGEVQGARRHGGQARHLLLRRWHLGHDRSLRAAPARLRRPDALRRLHGGVGEGPALPIETD